MRKALSTPHALAGNVESLAIKSRLPDIMYLQTGCWPADAAAAAAEKPLDRKNASIAVRTASMNLI